MRPSGPTKRSSGKPSTMVFAFLNSLSRSKRQACSRPFCRVDPGERAEARSKLSSGRRFSDASHLPQPFGIVVSSGQPTIATPAFKSAQSENIVTKHFRTYISTNLRLVNLVQIFTGEHHPPRNPRAVSSPSETPGSLEFSIAEVTTLCLERIPSSSSSSTLSESAVASRGSP